MKRSPRTGLVVLLLFFSRGLASISLGQEPSLVIGADRDARLRSRIDSLKVLQPEEKRRISEDLQKESVEHFGFPAVRDIDEVLALDLPKISEPQKRLIDQTTMHLIDGNLVPLAVTEHALKRTGNQIYPDLQKVIESSSDTQTLAVAGKVGRIRYWNRNGRPFMALPEADAKLAGTGFVIAPGRIATACHVLDYFVNRSTGSMSELTWAKIDFSADRNVHQTFLITGVEGKGKIKGQDFAILKVSTISENSAKPLPEPVRVGPDAATDFVGIIGYPNLSGASLACSSSKADSCDGSNAWFSAFAAKNPEVIKIISPGRKTGNFSPLGFPIFTYDAPTLEGQSGSPVIDLSTNLVIGLHYCCTGYEPSAKQESCALLQPLSIGPKSSNEALAIKNVIVP